MSYEGETNEKPKIYGDPDDHAFECSMCGKPMSYRFCGMCWSCEQIDNDVPDVPQMEACVMCGELTHNVFEDGKPLCDLCEENYWSMIADEHSGSKDE